MTDGLRGAAYRKKYSNAFIIVHSSVAMKMSLFEIISAPRLTPFNLFMSRMMFNFLFVTLQHVKVFRV